MGVLIWLVTFLIVVSSDVVASKTCDRCLQKSRATFYSNSHYAFLHGACGYATKDTKFDVSDLFAGAPASIFEKGVGCGRCYQVTCTDTTICSKGGVNVTVTDQIIRIENGAFVLSEKAFKAMAKNNDLIRKGNTEIQYKRMPCNYGKKTMKIWVEYTSNKDKNYLAIKFLYKEGQTDIVAVSVATAGKKNWVEMVRKYGAIWETNNTPKGALKFKIVVLAGSHPYTTAKDYGLPAGWKSGKEYDSGLQFTDVVAKDTNCKTCG